MKKLVVLFVISLVVLLIIGCTKSEPRKKEMQNSNNDAEVVTVGKGYYIQVTIAQGKDMIESYKDEVILDVRTIEEYNEGHIPGAICIPNEEIGEEELKELPDKKALIMVYCRSGNRSKEAAKKLVKLGYSKVYEFGGILDWDGEIVKE